MRYGILGPLLVDDGATALAQGRQRLLLAILLVHANEAVTTDVLLDALWDDEPPPTALRGLHNLVGALRKLLPAGALVTEGRAYRLHVGPAELDAEQFERLAQQRKRHEALALWRGPALGDLAGERALRDAAARLDERRLAVLEDRIDDDLRDGRHSEVIAELESLVRAHPLRERLRAQEMLALYRSGRQAEALHAYSEARHHLVGELGIEPGPALRELERAVLAHDPSLGAPTSLPGAPRSRRRWMVSLAAALAGTAAVVAVAARGSDPPQPAVPVRQAAVIAPDVVVPIDPLTNKVLAGVPVGATPVSVEVGSGAVWTLSGNDMTISRVDLTTKRVRTFATGGPPVDLAVGGGTVWVSQTRPEARDTDDVTTPAAFARLDPESGVAGTTEPLPIPARAVYRVPPGDLTAFGAGAAWIISRPGWLHRVDLETGHRRTSRSLNAMRVAADDDEVWIQTRSGALLQLDPRTGRRLARVPVIADWISALAVGGGAAWVTDKGAGTLSRVDARTRMARTVDVGVGADALAFGEGAAWVGNSLRGTVTRVDPATGRVDAVISVRGTPRALAVGGGHVWVGVADAAGSAPAAGGLRASAKVHALGAPPCRRVVTGPGGDPDLLIASDLPLQAQQQVTQPMAAAVEFVLRRRDFRAGRFKLGVQSCDDATAQYGVFDEATCAANARAYAANPAVIGVIGPVNTQCAERMLPALSPASVALVSPTNSMPATVRGRSWPGYARLYPSDDYVTAAGAIAASRLGASVFFVEDREYSATLGTRVWFERAADRIGLRIAGRARFSVDSREYRRLARRVRASGASVVYINTVSTSHIGPLLRDLRAVLGSDVPFVGEYGLLPAANLWREAGDVARGVHVVSHAMGIDDLGQSSRDFIEAFGATQPNGHVSTVALYAAVAAEVLLDAIAHSDGTRASVVRALGEREFATLIGRVAFRPNGEPDRALVELVRVESGKGEPAEFSSVEGTAREPRIEVSRSLVE